MGALLGSARGARQVTLHSDYAREPLHLVEQQVALLDDGGVL